MESGEDSPVVVGNVLLERFSLLALDLCTRLGIGAAVLSAAIGALSSEDRLRRVAAPLLVLVAWITTDLAVNHGGADRLVDPSVVLTAAGASFIPFAVDGHAQSNVFLGLAPLAGVAAVTCSPRQVVVFALVWSAAYAGGTMVGGDGTRVFTGAEHPYAAAQQIIAIVASSALFAAAVVAFRRFIEKIPETIALLRVRTANQGVAGSQAGAASAREWTPNQREREIFDLLCDGVSRDDIAERMYLSRHTVKESIDRVRAALDVHTEREAVGTYERDYRHRE